MTLTPALQRTFEIAYQKADDPLRKRVAQDYARRLREDSKPAIEHYDQNFLQIDFLDRLTPPDCAMIRQHLLGALASTAIYPRISGLGLRLAEKEIPGFVDTLVRRATYAQENWKRSLAEKYLNDEVGTMADDELSCAIGRLQAWQRMFEEKGQIAHENVVRRLLGVEEKIDPAAKDDDLPF
jgi:hypothetical protein